QIDTIQQAHAQQIEQLNATLAQQSNQFTQEQTKWTSEKQELAQRCVTLEKELEDKYVVGLYHKNLSEFQKAVLNVPMSPNKMIEGQREAFENEQKTNERLHREALQMMQQQMGKLEGELSAQKELYATCLTQLQDMAVRYGELTEEKKHSKTNTSELVEHKNELKNHKETIGNLQKLVKSLKTEKETVEKKLDQSQTQ
ncbi:vesicular transport factor, partial [Reticulomyxa filosa]